MDRVGNSFNRRAFITLMVTISSLVLPVTGFIMHFSKEAGITAEIHGLFMLHFLFGAIFIVFAIWHIYLNRRAFFKTFKSNISPLLLSREAGWAFTISLILILLLVFHHPEGH